MKILSIAPTRLSLFGGGTDVDPYASTYGGIVINAAINIRQRMLMYSDDDIFSAQNIFPDKANPEFYYAFLKEYSINSMIHTKLACAFDGHIESGIGSSASAAVALLGAINKRLKLNMSRSAIAEKAWEIEVKKLGLYGGKQDQYAAVYGGMNMFTFEKKRVNSIRVSRYSAEVLKQGLVLVFLGFTRKSPTIQNGFKKLSFGQKDALDKIKQLAFDAIGPVEKGDIEKVGYLLDESWEFKKLSNKGITTPEIDMLYDDAIRCGALGGKVLGSGGGGYMLFVVPPEKRERLVACLGKQEIDFDFDWNGLETRIV